MNDLQIFSSDEFGSIRTVVINNEVWFIGKDIAEALGYKNTKDAISSHVDDEDKKILQRSEIATIENHIPKSALPVNFVSAEIPNRGITTINESGVYSLVFASKLPTAKKFKHWVTSEVLPSIRKNGSYGIPKTTSGQIQLLAQGYTELEQKINEVSKDLEDFKTDLPLLAVECEKITKAVKIKGVEMLGGRDSEAYADRSLSSKVYQDIHNEVKRQFGVSTYKAIKRSQCDEALEIIKAYSLPVVLRDAINNANAQRRWEV